jgi:hypothetical protein
MNSTAWAKPADMPIGRAEHGDGDDGDVEYGDAEAFP